MIPSNVLEIPNSESNGQYLSGWKVVGAPQHPARFPARLPQFFIRMLTEPDDLVVDIFAGSNTTGWVAEADVLDGSAPASRLRDLLRKGPVLQEAQGARSPRINSRITA